MNDRYLFKAKIKGATAGHEELDWAVGNLIVEQRTGRHFIVDLSHFSSTTTKFEDIVIEVDPSTICQCIGLKDKNGKLMFEHDIVSDENGNMAEIIWNDEELQYLADYEYEPMALGKWCSVSGNVFDNPELLEK